jgi:glycosyltransferase involved in cell wall biosynthesis
MIPQHESTKPVVLDVRVVTGTGGGPDKTILNSPRFLEPMGYRNLCAYMHPPGDPCFEILRKRAEDWNAPLISIPDRGPWDWRVVTQLLAVCRRENVAIWHGHDYKSDLIGLILRRSWPMRLVTTVHGWGVKGSLRAPFYNRIDRLCLPRYEAVICVSEDLQNQCLACGVPVERCILIENAIDRQQYSRSSTWDEAKRALGIPPHRSVIGAVGRLSAEKGFDLLIRAADCLLKKGHDLHLIIVGEGDQRCRLETLISEVGRNDRIRLLGYRPDTVGCYQAMDVYVLSSLSEGLPNVVLEAMALEVPVVAARVGAVPQIIDHEESGLIVEPGSSDGLVAALSRLLTDATLRARLAQAGCTSVTTRYSFEARMRRVRAIYDRLLGRTPALESVNEAVATAGSGSTSGSGPLMYPQSVGLTQ